MVPAAREREKERGSEGGQQASSGAGRWQLDAMATALGVINFYYYDTD